METIQGRLQSFLGGEGETILRQYIDDEIAAQGSDLAASWRPSGRASARSTRRPTCSCKTWRPTRRGSWTPSYVILAPSDASSSIGPNLMPSPSSGVVWRRCTTYRACGVRLRRCADAFFLNRLI